ncbi:O-methyltransferase [Staphylococcus carnosus]|uniref:tRNA 5-hydroxyuridine methyltransferase n=1 Tax=Staphylococcus carnosus (strain TM300) TaxID=396513 RepID=B9DNG9_STACT|nr:O-methyltransferase [Staphylococcus carnosus]ANZ33228.1 methyltransferase [Staphylococcus carnosus]KOR13508.1 methyltransferase [Staphylococcus carnosus]QPT04256.1 O-methyltransferase [Staphylococcus carnosus]UQA66981.1 O-methyltransferase [Staphylococcus carnosus]UTB78181.1 methyltransferase [Staphylococcus carnosus]
MDKNENYLINLSQKHPHELEALRPYAEENNVPIIHPLSLDMIKQLIRIHHSKQILEIGTAIGYSAMHFASVNQDIQVWTIERDETMQATAKENLANFSYGSQVHMIKGDARETFEDVQDKTFDMIFIDAAKAQSQKFFELYTPLLKEGGLVIIDNILYHDFVADIDVVRSRNVKQMVKKIQKFNTWLNDNPHFETNFLDIEDGLAIAIKGESK